MGQQEDIEAKIAEKRVSKINGQPTDRELTQLKKELVKIAAGISTSLGGGKHGHVGLIVPEAEYVKFSHEEKKFDIPAHPGHYPASVSSNATTRSRQEAKHKALIAEYEVCTGVINGLKEKIKEAIDEEWLEEISDEVMEFQNVSILEMLDHLGARGGEIDYIDIQEIKKERDAPWNTNEHIVKYFSNTDRAVKRLKRSKVDTSEKELMSNALYTIKESGEMERALEDWDKKPEAERTWKECKNYFSRKYADRRKHKSIEAKQAGFGSANQAQETSDQELIECTDQLKEALQQMTSSESSELKKIIERQEKMLEANQQLMQQIVQNMGKSNQSNNQNGNRNGGGKKSPYQDWQTKKVGDSIEKEGKTWWWCPDHNQGKGLYVRHKPANHHKWKKSMDEGGRRYTDNE